eukprot:SAG22_NODE_1999_length_3178_cov_12.473530_6_plen_85_part_00
MKVGLYGYSEEASADSPNAAAAIDAAATVAAAVSFLGAAAEGSGGLAARMAAVDLLGELRWVLPCMHPFADPPSPSRLECCCCA